MECAFQRPFRRLRKQSRLRIGALLVQSRDREGAVFSSGRLGFNQPLADGVANQFASIVQIELAHQIALVGIHRLDAQV
jgi:hypothetical protein